MDERTTRAWRLYDVGVSYNHRLSPDQYRTVETNTEFFIGNQWLHLPETPATRRMPKPTFNILKRVASLFIASLTSSGTAIRVEPLAHYAAGDLSAQWAGHDMDADSDASDFANAALDNLLEKFKFEYRIRDALFDGAVSGDYAAHFWFDPDAPAYGGAFADSPAGEIRMELVDGINVMFGNPNDRAVEHQPYILLVGRDTVGNLRAEARQHRGGAKEADTIQEDAETETQIGVGGKIEAEPDEESETGKVLYVLMYERVNGTIHVSKSTRTNVIYSDVDTGLSVYPIAWGNWEKQKNQFHGRALVTGLIPNQIFINRMFASAMRHLQLMAFPKVVYNGDLIPLWDDSVGTAIRVTGLAPGTRIPDLATTIQPAEMSGQIFSLIDKVMDYTKDCLGATDAQMGNVKPDNTSALMVLQTNAEVPLENIRAGLYEWTEDVGHILLDMMGTYYGLRPVVVEREFEEPLTGPGGMPQIDPVTGMMSTRKVKYPVADMYDFSQFKHMWLNLKVDVGATTYFSEIAMTQTLDNLRRDGILSAVQYLERVPDKLIPNKQQLIQELEEGAGMVGDPMAANGGDPAMGGPLSEDKMMGALPQSMQARANAVPSVAKSTLKKLGNMKATRL